MALDTTFFTNVKDRYQNTDPDKYEQFRRIFAEQAGKLSQMMSAGAEERERMVSETRDQLATLFATDSDLLAQYDQFMKSTPGPPPETSDAIFINKVYARLDNDAETKKAFQEPFAYVLQKRFASPIIITNGSVATQEQWEQDWKELGEPVKASLKGYPDLQLAFKEWYAEKDAEIIGFGTKGGQ